MRNYRSSRAVALGLLLLPLLLIAGAVLLLDRAEAEHAETVERVALLAKRAVSLDQLLAERDEMAGAGDGGAALDGSTPAIAGAALQRHMDKLLLEHGATVDSFLVLPPVEEPGFQRIGLRVAFSAGISTLRDVLQLIEAGSPALFVQNLSVRNDASTPEITSSTGDPALAISLEVYGFVRQPEVGA